jgi:hypothetical protein
MVGKEMARARLPAILMSTANSSTIVGMRSSPPATPIKAARMPMPTPAASPKQGPQEWMQFKRVDVAEVVRGKRDGDQHQQSGEYPAEGC